MKKLKKTAVLLTVLALALSLSACGESELTGTWKGRLEGRESVMEASSGPIFW